MRKNQIIRAGGLCCLLFLNNQVYANEIMISVNNIMVSVNDIIKSCQEKFNEFSIWVKQKIGQKGVVRRAVISYAAGRYILYILGGPLVVGTWIMEKVGAVAVRALGLSIPVGLTIVGTLFGIEVAKRGIKHKIADLESQIAVQDFMEADQIAALQSPMTAILSCLPAINPS